MSEQLWECPKCGVVVKVTEVGTPVELDAQEMMECVQTVTKFKNWGRVERGIIWRALILRFACWLCGMDLEVEDACDTSACADV